jgi:hypothetical protein
VSAARLASTVVLDRAKPELLVDGEPFPWYLADDGPRFEPRTTDDLAVVWLPLLADRVEIRQ